MRNKLKLFLVSPLPALIVGLVMYAAGTSGNLALTTAIVVLIISSLGAWLFLTRYIKSHK